MTQNIIIIILWFLMFELNKKIWISIFLSVLWWCGVSIIIGPMKSYLWWNLTEVVGGGLQDDMTGSWAVGTVHMRIYLQACRAAMLLLKPPPQTTTNKKVFLFVRGWVRKETVTGRHESPSWERRLRAPELTERQSRWGCCRVTLSSLCGPQIELRVNLNFGQTRDSLLRLSDLPMCYKL